jgi:hypothetical protein
MKDFNHAGLESAQNDAIEKLETTVGITNSTDASSLTYRLDNLDIDDVTPTTAKGDLIVENGSNAVRLPVGTNDQLLTADSGEASGVKWADAPTSVSVTTKGDLQGYDSAPARIPVGTNNQVLTADSGEALGVKWADVSGVDVTTKGDIQTYSTSSDRLPVGTDGQVLKADSSESTGLAWGDTPETTHVMSEVPSGTVDSSNTDFTLSNTPATGSLRVYVNGVRQKVTDDYTLSGTTVTFITAPETGDKILCDYFTTAGEIAQGSTSFVYDETPSGTVDGANTSFTLANTPVSGTLQLYRDGQLLKGGSADYSLSGTTITMTTAPVTDSVLTAFYQQSLSVAGNADTLDGYHADTFLDALQSGWFASGETWTYASSDDPTYTLTISGDKTNKYSAGMRVKLTDSGTQYFIITKVAYSDPNTTLTLYGGTDYDLSTGTITEPYFSSWKAPLGFPLETEKWTEETTSASNNSTASPTQYTWYNATSLSVPIGSWNIYYHACPYHSDVGTDTNLKITISTANNSESDPDLTCATRLGGASATLVVYAQSYKNKNITLSSKTSYYLNYSTLNTGMSTIGVHGDWSVTIIRAVCAYL